jgi:nicotinate-nucleotide adenylyltransferase
MRIGIFGGTFDPFTQGHAAVVKNAFDQLKLDKIYIVPTIVNYYRKDKRYLFNFEEKVEIITEFIARCFKNYSVEIDSIEKGKAADWRTIDLVQYFKKKFPHDEFYLIVGEDSYNEFKTWTRWEDILSEVTLCVANRNYGHSNTFEWRQKDVPALGINMGDRFDECSATNTRNRLIQEMMDLYLSDSAWYNELAIEDDDNNE